MKIFKEEKITFMRDTIDVFILSILGFSFLAYSVFFKHFAEIHIKLPFLNFPIFIGEIILFVCLGLTVYKWALTKKKFNGFYCAVAGGLLFVLIKAFIGYAKFGPLAFRHAAMFYYPLFAVMAYEAYQDKFKNAVVLAPLFLVFILFRPMTYYNFTYLILMALYIFKVPNKTFKILGLAVIGAFFPFFMLLHCSRAQLVGHIFGFVTLGALLLLILKIKTRTKLIIAFLCLSFLAIGLMNSKSCQVRSIITPHRLFAQMKEWDKHIEKIRGDYQREEIPVKLYNKEQMDDVNMPRAAFLAQRIKQKQQNQRKTRCLIGTYILLLGILSVLKIKTKHKLILAFLSLPFFIAGIISLRPQQAKPLTASGAKTELVSKQAKPLTASGAKTKLVDKREKKTISGKGRGSAVKIKKKKAALKKKEFTLAQRYNTAIFRLFVWRDIRDELLKEKKYLFGFNFGKPLRSERNEIIKMAYGEWSRDGWLAAHNSYMEALYRSGLIGIALIACMFSILWKMTAVFVRAKSVTGVCLISILVYWLTTALFYVTLDMPYTAISFWSLFGIALAYSRRLRRPETNHIS